MLQLRYRRRRLLVKPRKPAGRVQLSSAIGHAIDFEPVLFALRRQGHFELNLFTRIK